jgi:hypothetical protein
VIGVDRDGIAMARVSALRRMSNRPICTSGMTSHIRVASRRCLPQTSSDGGRRHRREPARPAPEGEDREERRIEAFTRSLVKAIHLGVPGAELSDLARAVLSDDREAEAEDEMAPVEHGAARR